MRRFSSSLTVQACLHLGLSDCTILVLEWKGSSHTSICFHGTRKRLWIPSVLYGIMCLGLRMGQGVLLLLWSAGVADRWQVDRCPLDNPTWLVHPWHSAFNHVGWILSRLSSVEVEPVDLEPKGCLFDSRCSSYSVSVVPEQDSQPWPLSVCVCWPLNARNLKCKCCVFVSDLFPCRRGLSRITHNLVNSWVLDSVGLIFLLCPNCKYEAKVKPPDPQRVPASRRFARA